jgi:hypothetical protein
MKLTNFILFQAGWFITLFSAAYGKPYLGVLFTVLWMIFHLSMVATKVKNEISFLVIVTMLAYLLESSLVISGFISYPEQAIIGVPAPIWMMALWVNLAATINYSLSWMKGRYFICSVFAAIAGPLSYFAGERIGAINLHGTPSLIIISLMYGFVMPFLFWLNRLINETKYFNKPVISGGVE